ncbi:MAG: T9SS type A sorting domain-containing protein [Saprospiraceae bacterium]|jgi:hypothetical protein|nr:T9SS type A sorting domain-containing protein [Saprospiraceae bacterium]MBP9209376.1 T9SS type A sorting domain-containing protein [Saprospiraceae bacterium]MBV6474216.1 hypothetical protein [Saprospiraceae bacterium]
MKRKFLKLLAFSLVITVNITGQINNGLKAYYPFSGNANDYSGQNFHGKFVGNPTLTTDRFGMENCAYQFPGNETTYIQIKYNSIFDVSPQGAFSISLWHQGGTKFGSGLQELFQKGDPSNTDNYGYTLALYDLNKPVFGNGLLGVWGTRDTFIYPDTNWYHLVAIYNNKNWYLYENAILQSTNLSGKYGIAQARNNIRIGKEYLGKIDDIRFYNRVLDTNEIFQIFKLSSSCQITESENIPGQSFANIFPNPTNTSLTVALQRPNDFTFISIYNLMGVELSKYSVNSGNANIDLTNFANGIYIIRIHSNGMFENKLIEKY